MWPKCMFSFLPLIGFGCPQETYELINELEVHWIICLRNTLFFVLFLPPESELIRYPVCVFLATQCVMLGRKEGTQLSSVHVQFIVKGRPLFCKILESSKGAVNSKLPCSSQRNKSVVF